MQIQCTIALVSDAQIEGKVSVTPKSRLARNIRKTYYNNFAASSVLACGQPSQEAPKNTNQLMDNFYVLSGILVEKYSFQVSCEFNAKLGAIDRSIAIDLLATPALHHSFLFVFMPAFPLGRVEVIG